MTSTDPHKHYAYLMTGSRDPADGSAGPWSPGAWLAGMLHCMLRSRRSITAKFF